MEMVRISNTKNVIKVGDIPNDMMQGKNANCKWVIGVNSGEFKDKDLIDSGADFIVSTAFDILNLSKK